MQEREEIFHYQVVCDCCLRHLYKPPKHNLVYWGRFTRLCSDRCLRVFKDTWPIATTSLLYTVVNEILKKPELYDIECLPPELRDNLRWAINNKNIEYRKAKGRCGCVAFDCYEWSKKL